MLCVDKGTLELACLHHDPMQNDSPTFPDHDAPESSTDWEALARYLAGESSAAESERIGQWLKEHKADAALVAALEKSLAGLASSEQSDIDVDRALARVIERRDSTRGDPASSARRPPPELRYSRRTASMWRAAAILAAAAAVVVAARLVLQRDSGERSPAATAGAGRTFATAVGKRDSLRLPDGARVVLGPASRLVVAASYGRGTREVELHGEAYFDVVHDTTRSFVVRAGDVSVRDVGTSFGVRADSGRFVQVVVTSGSVRLRSASADSGLLLVAGDVGTVQPDGRVTSRHIGATGQYLAWMRDSLVFRDASLPEVSDELRRWYGVVLRVEDPSLAERHLTMTFAGDPIDRVLRVIGLGLGTDIERRGDTAIVHRSTPSSRAQ
ncbi:MAG TPA: FecR domain-containing protein [Gemmatimonadaceae bacterium]|nr:FecR domain-containing protein [Gemmatimonadaceae bacterium]